MRIERRPLEEVLSAGYEALFRELGYADATRFISQFCPGHGNYTEERRAWADDLSLEELIEEAKAVQRRPAAAS